MPFAVGTLKRSGKNQLSTSFETWLVVLYTNCKAIGQSLSSSKTKVRILFLPLLKLNFVYWLLYFLNYLEGHESMFSHLNFVCCIKLPLTHVSIYRPCLFMPNGKVSFCNMHYHTVISTLKACWFCHSQENVNWLTELPFFEDPILGQRSMFSPSVMVTTTYD